MRNTLDEATSPGSDEPGVVGADARCASILLQRARKVVTRQSNNNNNYKISSHAATRRRQNDKGRAAAETLGDGGCKHTVAVNHRC